MGKLIADKYAEWKEKCERRFQLMKKNEENLNRIFIEVYGLQDEEQMSLHPQRGLQWQSFLNDP